MAFQIQGNGGVVADVGGTTFRALHTHAKPLEFGALGHYRLQLRIASTAVQAANARLFEIRNPDAAVLVIPTRLSLRALQTAAGTAQENSIDAYKVTGFSVVDTTNTTTPVPSVLRTGNMAAAASMKAVIRSLNAAAAGMTGGTLTKDANAFASLPYNVAAAIGTTSQWGPYEAFDDVKTAGHPFVFAQNEGLIVENRVLNVTSYGITWFLDFSWAEVNSF